MTESAVPTASLPPAELLVTVARWLDEGARWIAVDGLGASGKTTLADQLAAHVDGLAVVHLDDFTRPGAVGWERERFREQVYEPLRVGVATRHQRHHWTSTEPTDWVELSPGRGVLVEGVGASEPPEGLVWDRVLWVAAPQERRHRRAEARDVGRFECWAQNWRPVEQEWFERARPWRGADLVWVNP
ncbi:hypothetical protein ACPCG0_05445 [Propionibacteriaceae bacterium Y1923]|uniref:hypothetical protein n=1 Tax=Aestuariimicrobium sp. Y1814 TaxID=3418742 RepID=UPI003C1B7402